MFWSFVMVIPLTNDMLGMGWRQPVRLPISYTIYCRHWSIFHMSLYWEKHQVISSVWNVCVRWCTLKFSSTMHARTDARKVARTDIHACMHTYIHTYIHAFCNVSWPLDCKMHDLARRCLLPMTLVEVWTRAEYILVLLVQEALAKKNENNNCLSLICSWHVCFKSWYVKKKINNHAYVSVCACPCFLLLFSCKPGVCVCVLQLLLSLQNPSKPNIPELEGKPTGRPVSG